MKIGYYILAFVAFLTVAIVFAFFKQDYSIVLESIPGILVALLIFYFMEKRDEKKTGTSHPDERTQQIRTKAVLITLASLLGIGGIVFVIFMLVGKQEIPTKYIGVFFLCMIFIAGAVSRISRRL